MSSNQVRIFFDYNSPYSYFASLLIEEVCGKHGAELSWEPFVIGGIFQADGTSPPHAIPKRASYMFRDLINLAEYHGLPYRPRTDFLFSPILSLRATIQVEQGARRAKAVHGLFAGAFADDRDLSEPETVRELLDKAGLDGHALVTGAQQKWVKEQLKTNSEEALSMGVFGAPTIFLNDEMMFWGHDRLKLLDYFLEKAEK